MAKYIDAEKLITNLERQNVDKKVIEPLIRIIDSLTQEQPDNEDIDKVAQELYEHLYELKRRNNVPTNLYDKQEIIALWKAGIEYAYNHPKQEQPMPDSTKLIELWHEDKEMLKEKDFRDDPWRLAYNAFMCGFGRGITVKKQEQPKVDLEEFDKDVAKLWGRCAAEPNDSIACLHIETFSEVARHFYELGLKARK